MRDDDDDFSDLTPVEFAINGKEWTTPEMMALGHTRVQVIALFEKLHSLGFGVYTPGGRGPGNSSRFKPNEKCPPKYTILFRKVGTRKKTDDSSKVVTLAAPASKVPTPVPQKPVNFSPKVAAAETEEPDSAAPGAFNPEYVGTSFGLVKDWLRGLTGRVIVKDRFAATLGYECVVYGDEILAVVRIRGGGSDSIEDALNVVWSRVKDRVGVKHTTKAGMTVKDAVISRLKGNGYYVLDRIKEFSRTDKPKEPIQDDDEEQ